jgi:prepilin-type processing-associated H-X9-DG protein
LQRGFTLLEIFVIFCIVAILAAIILPIFAPPRERAKQVSCLSNHKQLALGIMMYAEDYDKNLPMTANMSTPDKTLWTQAIYPYVKNKSAFICPQAKRTNAFLLWTSDTPTSLYADSWERRDYASIGLTSQLLFNGGLPNTVMSLNALEDRANTVLLADTQNVEIGRPRTGYQSGFLFDPSYLSSYKGYEYMPPPVATLENPIVAQGAIMARHNKQVPLGFADGHVKMLNVEIINKNYTKQGYIWRFR